MENGAFEKKEEVENSSEVLLNPSDPEATFRYKAGGKNLGYVGNVVESVSEHGSLITDYAYEKNIYADNQLMKDYLSKQPRLSDEVLFSCRRCIQRRRKFADGK